MPASLLSTKFLIQPVGNQCVSRPRLLQSLDNSLQHAVTLLSAPAGYGKTSVLADWVKQRAGDESQRERVPVAWVALDEGDNDPVRFWGYALTALQRLPELSGILGESASTLQAAAPPVIQSVLTNVINCLTDHTALPDFVLVLDDFQNITAPPIHAELAFLLDHLPPQMHLIIASRADPPLALARLRVRGQLLELRAHDLRFTPDEAARFLNGVMHLALSSESVTELETHTEGWIAGLQLAALSLKGRSQPLKGAQSFTGQNHFVLEYVIEEVVGSQPVTVQQFLGQTCILDRLCGPLCAAVTDQPDASETLVHLWRNNLFTEPLDETGHWYRLHPLIAEVLLAQLQRTQPGMITDLHRRARDWYAQNGFLYEAMRHARAGKQFEWMAETIEREWHGLIARGEFATLRGWLEALPPDLVAHRPRSLLAQAWSSVFSSRFDVLDHYLTQAKTALSGWDAAEAKPLQGEILALRAVIGSVRGEVTHTLETARQAFELMQGDDGWPRALAHQALGNAYRLQGQPVLAGQEFEKALPLTSSIGPPATLATNVRLGQVQVMRGRLHQASQTFQHALGLASDYGGSVALFAAEAHIHLGDIYREWGQLDLALDYIVQGIDLAKRADNVIATLAGDVTLIHVQAARGELAQARETVQRVEAIAAHYDFPHLPERVALHRAWLDVIAGDLDSASRWAATYAADRVQNRERPEQATDFADTLLARVLIRTRRAAEALPVLAATRQQAESAGRGWAVIQTHLLESIALHSHSEPDRGQRALEQALCLAAPEGYQRMFMDEGDTLLKLLPPLCGQSSLSSVARAYARNLLKSGNAAPFERLVTLDDGSLIEPLSHRELEVLRLVADGASNQAIAEMLVISLGTVKSHVNRILGKLASHSRTEAVARSRALGLT